MTEKIHAIKHILATIFAAQNALRSLAPEFKWSGLGNLLGDYGEWITIEKTRKLISDYASTRGGELQEIDGYPNMEFF